MPWTTETILKVIELHGLAECVTEARLAELAGLTDKQVESAVGNLIKHGFLRRTAKGCHKLTDAGQMAIAEGAKLRSGPKGPEYGHRRRAPGLRQTAWNVLRMGGKRTIDDILMRAIQGTERDAYSNIRKYVRALSRAGYVHPMTTREQAMTMTSNGCIRWYLVKDTGPVAPVWRESRGTLWDPNIEVETPLASEAV
jgi:predicted transcriptional regulator